MAKILPPRAKKAAGANASFGMTAAQARKVMGSKAAAAPIRPAKRTKHKGK